MGYRPTSFTLRMSTGADTRNVKHVNARRRAFTCVMLSAATTCTLIMVALWNRADHYIFMLWLLSIFYLFPSPNLSGCTLDVYHTSTHGVALVRI